MAGSDFVVSESFKRRADSAAFFEAYVAARLTRLGLYVMLNPVTIAKPGEDLSEYHRSVDLTVYPPGLGGIPVEVKSQNLTFADDPISYPKEKPLVCSESSWNHKNPTPSVKTRYDQLYVSRTTGAILWLPKDSPVELGVDVYDSKRGELYRAVATRRELLQPVGVFADVVLGGGR